MKLISQAIYEGMLAIGLLKPEIPKDENGKAIRVKDKETGRTKKIVNRKVWVVNKDKKSNAKSYYVEEPAYSEYLRIKEESK